MKLNLSKNDFSTFLHAFNDILPGIFSYHIELRDRVLPYKGLNHKEMVHAKLGLNLLWELEENRDNIDRDVIIMAEDKNESTNLIVARTNFIKRLKQMEGRARYGLPLLIPTALYPSDFDKDINDDNAFSDTIRGYLQVKYEYVGRKVHDDRFF